MTGPSPAAVPPAPSTVTSRLRAETRAEHVRLETSLALLDRPLSPARYRRLLERFYGFHAVLEPRLDAWHGHRRPLLADWPRRRKLHLLTADLAALGRHPAQMRSLARCADVPLVTADAPALGVLYVVEGATLGGRVIAAHLAASGVPAGALGFLTSYGDDVGSRWHHWRAVATAWVGDDRERGDALVAAAGETFEVLGRWLAPAGTRP